MNEKSALPVPCRRARRIFALPLALVLLAGLPAPPVAGAEPPRLWQPVAEGDLGRPAETRLLLGNRHRTVRLDHAALQQLLARTPLETPGVRGGVVMELPWPDGSYPRFRIEESPIMEPGLALQFPELKTYRGQGLDDPTALLRFDWTPAGFHGMVLSSVGTVYLDPFAPGDTENYISYLAKDYRRVGGASMRCEVTGEEVLGEAPESRPSQPDQISHGTQLRTYRLALAATGEYTAFYGGTVAGAMAGIVTSMNRVNGVYERDVAVRMVLVANNSSVVYTDPNGDPYTNSSGSTMLGQNQANLDSVIGNANYDVGHVFSTGGGGGVASLGVPCTSSKARGVTGSSSPVGDGYDIDYVAHEMGHQFGGFHTFNGTTGNCGGGNRSASAAYEPGSGTTIMAYAGICGAEDLAPHSDDLFHAKSQDQIINFITTGSGNNCPVKTATGNTPPTANAGADYTIPANTPFALTASGSDADGDTLTYAWEEYDLGAFAPPNTDADGQPRPIFRSFNSTTSPTRTFPKLSDILNNTSTFGEVLPTITRSMTFRVTVRDNRAGGGGSFSDDTVLSVRGDAGPFKVTSPDTAVSWQGASQQTVTWDVANTTTAPISAANVKISLSTDGGLSFPTVLAASTPNDGTELVTLPGTASTTARIKVEAVGNVFFDVSNANFTITAPAALLSVANASLVEGDTGTTNLAVTVTLSPSVAGTVTVNYATVPGTATAPADYTTTSGSLTFTSGQTTKTVNVPIVGDKLAEATETFTFNLSGASGAGVSSSTAVLTILDDDPTAGDFSGDGSADVVVFRSGAWLFFDYATGASQPGIFTGQPQAPCTPAPGDYNGDGKVEFAELCSDGKWYFFSPSGAGVNTIPITGWTAGDVPVPADYDGDGKDDVVVYRAGAWITFDPITTLQTGAVFTGAPGASPVPYPGDFDGDGKADLSIYSGGAWHFYNPDGSYRKGIWTGSIAGDVPVAGDYDGDGTDDVVVWRAGAWLWFDYAAGTYNAGKSVFTGSPAHFTGGTTLPAPIDVDGDGKLEYAVWSGGPWHFYTDAGTYDRGVWCGAVAGDRAVSRRPLP
jgi:hypothetical protein